MSSLTNNVPPSENSPETRKEEQVDSTQDTCDLLQCCHPKSAAAPLDCWTALTSFFQPRPDQRTHKGGESQDDGKFEGQPPVVDDDCAGAATPTCSASEKIAFEPEPDVPFTPEERHRLSKILELLLESHHESQSDSTEEATTSPRQIHDDVEEKKEISEKGSFLLKLGKAAATVALEHATNNSTSLSDNAANFDDNPEAAIQRLLETGKRHEALKERQQHHVQRVQTLIHEYPTLLQQPLESYWKTLEESITTKASDIKASTQQEFLSSMRILLGKSGESATLEFLMDTLPKDNNIIYNLMRLCFHLAVCHAFLTVRDANCLERLQKAMEEVVAFEEGKPDKDPALQAMLQSFNGFQSQFTNSNSDGEHDNFLQWHQQQTPSLLSSLKLCMHEILFPSLDDADDASSSSNTNTSWLLPSLDRDDKGSDNVLFSTESWLFAVACTLPPHHHKTVGPMWHRLYSSHTEGFNRSTLEHSLTGYHGPTLIIVEGFDKESNTNHTFGAFASQPWIKQKSPEYYGDADSFLFQLQPDFRVLRATPATNVKNLQYFYFDNRQTATPSPTTATKNDAKYENGLGLGGSRRRQRFFVSASLDTCYLGSNDTTFETTEQISSHHSFEPLWDLQSLEVCGVGGNLALQSLHRHRNVKEANLQKARQVDKTAFLNDFRSGLIESKMFGFREEMRNRDGGCLLDCHDEEDDR